MSSAVEKIKQLLGAGGYIDNPTDMLPYVKPWRGGIQGKSPLIAFPNSTQQVSEIVKICADAKTSIVPQGGMTGLVGGAVPSVNGDQIVVNLSRMNKIREMDKINYTITVEAGCILANIQKIAEENGRYFPLRIASEGSCQAGGIVSTNAGGTAVLKYGNARDLVMGLEVVLPDGSIWNGLRSLRKDNTGYDLKQLFIGAEGTLGMITAAIFKLFPLPVQREILFISIPNVTAALGLLSEFRIGTGDNVTMFEIISEKAISLVIKHVHNVRRPLQNISPYYLLVEVSSSQQGDFLRQQCENIVASEFEKGTILDCVIANSIEQSNQFRHLRETISEAEKKEGRGIHFDVSLPVSKVADFMDITDEIIKRDFPLAQIVSFGHIGDGNIHYNICLPKNMGDTEFKSAKEKLKTIIYEKILKYGGSISAEHGVGTERKKDLLEYKLPVEIDIMRKIKSAIDPLDIMNLGKIVDMEQK